jgi:hypothetical protein
MAGQGTVSFTLAVQEPFCIVLNNVKDAVAEQVCSRPGDRRSSDLSAQPQRQQWIFRPGQNRRSTRRILPVDGPSGLSEHHRTASFTSR